MFEVGRILTVIWPPEIYSCCRNIVYLYKHGVICYFEKLFSVLIPNDTAWESSSGEIIYQYFCYVIGNYATSNTNWLGFWWGLSTVFYRPALKILLISTYDGIADTIICWQFSKLFGNILVIIHIDIQKITYFNVNWSRGQWINKYLSRVRKWVVIS